MTTEWRPPVTPHHERLRGKMTVVVLPSAWFDSCALSTDATSVHSAPLQSGGCSRLDPAVGLSLRQHALSVLYLRVC